MASLTSNTTDRNEITIRAAGVGDGPALMRLAGLDSAPVPRGATLVAEVGGELRAALELGSGALIADPFRRTAELGALLRLRAAQMEAERPAGQGGRPGRRAGTARVASADAAAAA